MNKGSFLGGLAAAITAVNAVSICIAEAAYYPPPEDLGISADSIEIDKSSMNGDTVAEIPVYVHNNPGFSALKIIVELDGRLSFDSDLASTVVDGIAGVYVSSCGDSENTQAICFTADGERFQGDREIGRLRINIPGDISVGTYSVALLRDSDSEEIFIDTYNKRSARFYEEDFSCLEGGCITITDSSATSTVQENTPEPEAQETAITETAVEAVSDVETTTSAETATSTVPPATEREKVSKTAVQKLYDSLVETLTTIASAEDALAEPLNEEEKQSGMLVPAIIAVLLELGTAMVLIIRKGGRSK